MSELPTQARVVIIGGGVIGCSVASHLTKLGWTDVVLLERKQLTSGTTWHAAGLIAQLRATANMTKLAKYSQELYGGLEQETGVATGFKRCGSITVALTEERREEIFRQAGMARAFGVDVENFAVSPPDAPLIPAPVSLGQTIALDLQTSWWKGWWQRRKGFRAFASGFYELIEAETAPIVEDLKNRQLAEIRETALGDMADFLAEQRGILIDIADKSQIGLEDLEGLFGITAQKEREELFDIIFEELAMDSDAHTTVNDLTSGGAAA